MKKETRIPIYKRIWCRIRYYQMLYDISDLELAKCLDVSIRTLHNYDKDASNFTIGRLDSFLNLMELDFESFISDTKTPKLNCDVVCDESEHQIVYNDKTYYEINPCLGYKQNMYYISLDGEIYSKSKNGLLSPTTNKDGYLYQGMRTIDDRDMKVSVAKVMLTTFKGTPPDDMIDPTTEHINGQRNDNRIENLMWMERSENSSTRKHKGKGETNSKARLTEDNVKEICEILQDKQKSDLEIADVYNVTQSCVASIRRRKNWTYISDNYTF